MPNIDLNSDLGESYGPWTMGNDHDMLSIVSSANIACGGHAGDPETMFNTIKQAASNNVCIGAHPGFADKDAFGRRLIPMSATEVEQLIAYQVGAFIGIAKLANAEVRYVKAHGALANWAAATPEIAHAIASAVKKTAPDCGLLAISGTELEHAGKQHKLKTYSEIFADRAYQTNGQLVPRDIEGAVIHDADFASKRLLQFLNTGDMPTIDGKTVKLNAESICIHGDNPAAVDMAKSIKQALLDGGYSVNTFAE